MEEGDIFRSKLTKPSTIVRNWRNIPRITNCQIETNNFETEYSTDKTPFSKELYAVLSLYEKVKSKKQKLQKCSTAQVVKRVLHNKLNMINIVVADLNNEGNGECNLSLRRILPWARDSTIWLKLVLKFLDEAKEAKGGAILNPAIAYIPHGNLNIHQLFLEIVSEGVNPLIQMIWHWVVKGTLNDPFDEFFIFHNPNCGIDLWHEQYILRKDYLPSMINKHLGLMIIATGKVMTYINIYSPKKYSQIVERRNLHDFQEFCIPLLLNGDDDFEKHIETMYNDNSLFLLEILKQNHELKTFVENIHGFFFLSQGPFARHFMIRILEYDRSVNLISLAHLKSLLESAMIATTTAKQGDRVFHEVLVHLNAPTQADSLMDVFTLRYEIPFPLNQMFDTFEISYRKIFRFLWGKNHVSYLLSNSWITLRALLRWKYLPKDLIYKLSHVCLLTNQLMQFTYQLNFHIIYEIVDKCWKSFILCLEKSENIEEIINSHANMLSHILIGTLQEKQTDIYVKLRSLNLTISEIEELIGNLHCYTEVNNFPLEESSDFSVKLDILKRTAEDGVKNYSLFLKQCRQVHVLMEVYERSNINHFYN